MPHEEKQLLGTAPRCGHWMGHPAPAPGAAPGPPALRDDGGEVLPGCPVWALGWQAKPVAVSRIRTCAGKPYWISSPTPSPLGHHSPSTQPPGGTPAPCPGHPNPPGTPTVLGLGKCPQCPVHPRTPPAPLCSPGGGGTAQPQTVVPGVPGQPCPPQHPSARHRLGVPWGAAPRLVGLGV